MAQSSQTISQRNLRVTVGHRIFSPAPIFVCLLQAEAIQIGWLTLQALRSNLPSLTLPPLPLSYTSVSSHTQATVPLSLCSLLSAALHHVFHFS